MMGEAHASVAVFKLDGFFQVNTIKITCVLNRKYKKLSAEIFLQ